MAVDLSVIVVNWNSVTYLRSCLQSVLCAGGPLVVEVIVIDNGSFDGSDAFVAREFPTVRFIQSRENGGFARANNRAFEEATGRNVVFLNPDTEVVGAALERMSRFLDTVHDVGAVGCRLLNTDGTLQMSCIQSFPTLINQAVDAELLRKVAPRSPLWGMRALFEDPRTPARVEAVSGACLMIRSATFELVGRFSEDYFMYAEDLDLCFKLHQAGFANYYLGSAEVVHHGGQSSSAASEGHFANIVMRESVARFMRLRRGVLSCYLYRATTGIAAAARVSFLAIALVATLGQVHRPALQRALRKWTRILNWTLGREQWATRLGQPAA
ncbi:MAG: hypothetical protein DCC58_09715 [Chloroflexi bacterium]|nr:MAG: hypothetical protein DCC58_09715 [Chloroflexota bacterium]